MVPKMTLGNELALNNVLYVPKIRKNLVSKLLLSKYDFRIVFELNRVILYKNRVFVRKSYVSFFFFACSCR